MSRIPGGCASLALAVFVSQTALAQSATISLKPIAENVRRECVGGPDAGQACTMTSDCENDDGGVMHPECERLCGGDPEQPCVTSLDCPGSGTACEQQCYCNSVIKAGSSLFFLIDIFASGWSPHLLRNWCVTVDLAPVKRSVLPMGWDRPWPPIECSEDKDCPSRYPICASDGLCEGPLHDPCPEPFLDNRYPDDVLLGCPALSTTSCAGLEYRICGFIPYTCPALPFTAPMYLGTLILLPTEAACGTVTVTPSSAPASGLIDPLSTLIEPLDVEGLTIETGAECWVDCNENGTPDEGEKLEPGDFDFNHTIDLADFAAFQQCFYGDWYWFEPCPCVFDFNGNRVVDRGDLGTFTSQLAGP